MNKLFRVLALVTIALITVCCKKEPETPVELLKPSDYYPLKLGAYHIYNVDSISYNDFTDPVTIDSISYQVKEELTDTFYDLEANLCYRITRSKRALDDSLINTNNGWKVSDVWWVRSNNGNIERVEENNIYVSLMHPVAEGKEWDGNAFNYISSWDFTYENVGKVYNEYDETLIVNQKFFTDDKYFYQNYKEVYAKGIGLISRTRIDTESQKQQVLSLPEKGFKFYQVLDSYFIPE